MILPAELYDAIAITEQEESLYPTPGRAHKAPLAFIVKRDRLKEAFDEYWKAPNAAAPVAPERVEE